MRFQLRFLLPRVLALALGVALVSPPAEAETILLKNGRKIVGEVIGEVKGRLVVSVGGLGTIEIELDDIDRVIADDSDGSDYVERYTPPVTERPERPGAEPAPKEEGAETSGSGEGTEPEKEKGWTLERIRKALEEDPQLRDEIETLRKTMGIGHRRIRGRNQAVRFRRRAVARLKEIGILTLPAMVEELRRADRLYGSRNAARVILSYARKEDVAAYKDAMPVFLKALESKDQETRVTVSEILAKLTGKDWVLPRNLSGDLDEAQREVIARWREWWEEEGKAYFDGLGSKEDATG